MRGAVFIAWGLCLIVSANAIIGLVQLVRERGPTLQPLRLAGGSLFVLLLPLFAIPAALIISRQPRNIIGWLLMAPSLVLTVSGWMETYLATFRAAPPPATLPILLMLVFSAAAWLALIFPLLLIPLLFPTGRLLTPRWRWTMYLAAAMVVFFFFWAGGTLRIEPDFASWSMTNPLGFLPKTADQYILPVWTVLLAVLTVASLVSIIARYRRAGVVEKQQMKWLLYACAIFALVYIPSVLAGGFITLGSQTLAILLNLLFPLVIITIPVAITIAILRYRLFDIDVIIRLTLVYTILTGLLGLVYMGGIVLLQGLFRTLTGTSDIAVVITTLTIAALFNPLRLRIQEIIDRRFFRQKYNAEQALAEFAIFARSGSDLDSLTGMLVDIAQKNLQPTQVSIYLRTRE
jgi:hypothetical protein